MVVTCVTMYIFALQNLSFRSSQVQSQVSLLVAGVTPYEGN